MSVTDSKIHGTIPEWTAYLKPYGPYKAYFGGCNCHFSGRVPDVVASSDWWSEEDYIQPGRVEGHHGFDSTKYESFSEDIYKYYRMTVGEGLIYSQADNYALWVGERPADTKWVEDELRGHWEWTD